MSEERRYPSLEDLTIILTGEEIERARSEELGLVYTGSKTLAAAWMMLGGLAGGVLGGLVVSYALWSSVLLGLAVLVGFPASCWLFYVATERLFGRTIRFFSVWSLFCGFLLGLYAMWGAQLDSTGWAYGVSGGLALLSCAFFTGPTDPFDLKIPKAADFAMLFAPLAGSTAAYVHRNILAEPDTIAAAAQTGALAALLYSIPMITILAWLWDNSKGLKRLALLYLHNDRFVSEAIACLDAALKAAPKESELLTLRGFAYARAGDSEAADADWAQAQQLQPRGTMPLVSRAVAALRSGEVDEAVSSLEVAAKRRPKSSRIHALLGTALERRGDFGRAILHYDQAMERAPDARILTNLASARLHAGQYDEAIQDCRTAVEEFDSVFAKSRLIHAHALAALGQKTRAAKFYREAIEIGGEEGIADEARDKLERRRQPPGDKSVGPATAAGRH